MGFTLTSASAVEILDSRSRPTLAVRVVLADGTQAPARGAIGCVDRVAGGGGAAGRRPGPLRR